MSRNKTSSQSNIQTKPKPTPVRGTAVNQSGMLRRFNSSSDISRCSDSSSEDVYLSANEDDTWVTKVSGCDRRNSNVSNRSQSPASAPRTRSKSAGPREAPKDLAKTAPSSLGRVVPSGLQAKSSKINSLSKSLNFGSRELKQDLTDNQVNRRTIAPNKLLPDKPKLFQRSISTSAACLDNNDGQHRPIICGKDRKRLSSSMTLSKSFDELPEPQGDPDLFEQMELLFEEYRKLELGLYKKKIENFKSSDVPDNSQKGKDQKDGKSEQRGRKPIRENLPTSTSTKRQLSPSASQRNNEVISKQDTTPTKANQRVRPSSAPARREPPSQESMKDQTKLVPSQGRASPSPSRMKTRPLESTSSNRVIGQSVPKKGTPALSKTERSITVTTPRGRSSSAKQQSTSIRGLSPSASNRKIQKTASNKPQTSKTISKTSPAGSTQSLSTDTDSTSNPESASSSCTNPFVPTKNGRQPSNATKTERKESIHKPFAKTETCSPSVPSHGSLITKDDDVSQTSNLNDHAPDVSPKVKSNSKSNLRRSSECLAKAKQETEKTDTQATPLESSVDPVNFVPIAVPGRTSPVQKSRPSSPSQRRLNNSFSKSAITPDGKQNQTLGTGANGDKLSSKGNNGRPFRPGTPTFGKTKPSNAGNLRTGTSASENNAMKTNLGTQTKSINDSTQNENYAKSNHSGLKHPSGTPAKKTSSGIPTTPRGRIPDRKPCQITASSTRRSISLQRIPSYDGSKIIQGSITSQKHTGSQLAKSRSSVCVNKSNDEKSKVPNTFLSGSHPELPSSEQSKPKFTRKDTHTQSQYRSKEDLIDDLGPKNKRCQSSQEIIPSPRIAVTPHEDKEAQTTDLENTDDVLVFSTDDQFISNPRPEDRGGRRTRIPQPVGMGSSSKTYNTRQLNRCDSGVEINSMSPTESNANPDEPWQENNAYDFNPLNNTFDDSDDEYY